MSCTCSADTVSCFLVWEGINKTLSALAVVTCLLLLSGRHIICGESDKRTKDDTENLKPTAVSPSSESDVTADDAWEGERDLFLFFEFPRFKWERPRQKKKRREWRKRGGKRGNCLFLTSRYELLPEVFHIAHLEGHRKALVPTLRSKNAWDHCSRLLSDWHTPLIEICWQLYAAVNQTETASQHSQVILCSDSPSS